MTSEKINLGRHGEEKAVSLLCQHGYQILERNFKVKLGEIDIVAKDADTICFIEVKTRTSHLLESPLEAITPAKQRKLSQVALSYLKSHRLLERKARFDIVAISTADDGIEQAEIIKNAFELSSPYTY